MEARIAIPLVAAAVLGLSACNAAVSPPADEPASTQATANVEGLRDGQTTLAVGQTLTISLPSNATTGYRWQVAGVDGGVLLPGAPFGEEITDAHRPGMVGVGGQTIWQFQAVRPGTTTLAFTYGRSWERDTPPAETATYTITVR
ncbi:protease inhibitor I42 family protein [Brevundimonas sp. NIBR11]|uniref:protease inhibitor I42 family protein n=1 Tax=Brevundimonas sp. NIBR11 TaxID=3015999 RepID=UPI0022F0DC76|nr:protease inhibitor I42 family protein [Brevundimonas sp. NIBR11]WGM31642.1 hypothetical protein KKHFBJBL_01889 [Brevundimonas sp. NIBR11]